MSFTCRTKRALLRNLVIRRYFAQHFHPDSSKTSAKNAADVNLPSCSSPTPPNQNGHTNNNNNIHVHNREQWPAELLTNFLADCFVRSDFVSEEEEHQLLAEIYPHMKRMRWEDEHWDGQIHLYREPLIKRIWHTSFPPPFEPSPYVHILDLHQDGFIRPHLDKPRYCGRVISGLSLLSTAVMRMRHEDERLAQCCVADLLLSRRSLYRLCGSARYKFTHELLEGGCDDDKSRFGTHAVARERRIAVICREVPVPAAGNDNNNDGTAND
uniref:Alpha-ketoglutarate-dependent dioxygenase AlkB-like domain-containing protein n=1 Tax=Globodera rostochiensis TaxID=31243 RepID=A0A914IAJ5_GLORO